MRVCRWIVARGLRIDHADADLAQGLEEAAARGQQGRQDEEVADDGEGQGRDEGKGRGGGQTRL